MLIFDISFRLRNWIEKRRKGRLKCSVADDFADGFFRRPLIWL
ncbi:hypothetical protein NEISUBOT_05418 [Neisseria subflava NJ9703]|uniref:Uncharacterized protein n=1 Tax=Neisseria subflava NJ9703 TaxID=546268 RepID=A0A9W5IP32_NEISU|nr:hypothetical protein NEISUBOT_05418 [Neisseria subflava NJ9703]